jgi:hypothetical protein
MTTPEEPVVEEPNKGVLITLLDDGEVIEEPDGTLVESDVATPPPVT